MVLPKKGRGRLPMVPKGPCLDTVDAVHEIQTGKPANDTGGGKDILYYINYAMVKQ